ncbi:PDZ domain-containing protein [Gallaecimonas sp. GXIMD4217]|uniref:M61 family metallopeptidase n=1 Tax=Gallaecimonas sp. GXIMD4217 TaxID=3131927 RepID=UPI00311AC8A4
MSIHYHIRPASLQRHLFEVTLTIGRPDPAGQGLWLPNWIPGSYLIRDFAKHIVTMRALDRDDNEVAVTKTAKHRWQLAPCDGPVRVIYEVYAWDLSVRGAHLDQGHGFFNGTSTFLAVAGQEAEPVRLTVTANDEAPHWQLATALERLTGPDWGFGDFAADDYDALIDHPVEMGDFDLIEFEACGIPHALVLTGRHYGDQARLAKDLSRLCAAQIRFFGEPAPFDRYLFLTQVVGDGFGGLEHRNSTALMISRHCLEGDGSDYQDFLALCSHEYFHSWNVKRIKPAAFIPYSLDAESHTEQLWAYEGITSYYDDLFLHKAGLVSAEQYLDRLAATLTRVQRGAGRFKQTVTQSSFDAWTRFYQQDENAPNAIVSYYTKGALVALALDLTLRLRTENGASLDQLMVRLWEEFGVEGIGTEDDSHRTLAEQLAGSDLDEFFELALYSTQDLPLAPLLAAFGVKLDWLPGAGETDKGGEPGKQRPERLTLGIRTRAENGGLKVVNVFHGGAADRAGIAAGDQLVALDGLKILPGKLEQMVQRIGQRPAELHAFRRDELLTFEVSPLPAPRDTAVLTITEPERLQGWLRP